MFGLPLEPGFSDVLRGEVEASDAVRPTALSRLWLMPAGHWDNHALQALAQEGLGNQFEMLKDQFDFIVLDAAPVLTITDAQLLAQHMDLVLLSVLKDVSRLPAVYAAQQRLAALQAPLLGAVVIGASSELGGLEMPFARPTGGWGRSNDLPASSLLAAHPGGRGGDPSRGPWALGV